MKEKPEAKKDEKVSFAEYFALQQELNETRKEYGVAVEEGRLSRMVSRFFERRENRPLHAVDKKKYLLLAVFTGWMGGHRFYAKRYGLALLYLAFFWSGFPIAMTLIDLMAGIPMEADGEGKILL